MSCPHGNHPDGCERCAEIADHERAYELLFTENAKLRAEVERLAAQAAPSAKWQNGCNDTAPAALRFLAEHERPAGGQQEYNSEHLYQIADELEATYRAAQPSQAPVVQATSEPQTWHDLKARADALAARVAELEKDARRLDAVERNRFELTPLEGGGWDVSQYHSETCDSQLFAVGELTARAAIDSAALAAKGQA